MVFTVPLYLIIRSWNVSVLLLAYIGQLSG